MPTHNVEGINAEDPKRAGHTRRKGFVKITETYTTFEHVSEANILQRFIKFTVVSEPITNTFE